MKIEDLRIGNLVIAHLWRNDDIRIQEVISINIVWGEYYINYGFVEIGCEFGTKISEVEPIPLTEEWLIKFGFEQFIFRDVIHYEIRTKYETFNIYRNIDFSVFFIAQYSEVDKELLNTTQIKYVHQLQNLYFALTNEELKLKL